MLIYVDNIIVTGSSSVLIKQVITQLGELDYFLGIEVKCTLAGTLILTQAKYIRDLLQRIEMLVAKGISTPFQGNLKLSR